MKTQTRDRAKENEKPLDFRGMGEGAIEALVGKEGMEDLRALIHEYLEKRKRFYDEGYKKGYEEGFESGLSQDVMDE